MSALSCITAMVLVFGGEAYPLTPGDAPPKKKWAAARLADVDEDFGYQGEYFGEIRAVCGTPVPFGIQVVALGNGQFSALGYRDGLPGNGWDLAESISWAGERKAEVLVLKGPRGRLIVQSDVATVVDSARQVVGNLNKVRRVSKALGARPPVGATVLFDGSDAELFEEGKVTPEGWLEAGTVTKMPVQDFHLHIEFKTPYMPYVREQGRGNSGVYIQQRYEVQILDSFGLAPIANGCGALYRQQSPDLNMSFPPLAWQTYDIYFSAPRWDEQGKKIADARITVMHNGVRIHDNRPVTAKTGAGKAEGPDDRPIQFQHHGNPVHFRNIWLAANPAIPAMVERVGHVIQETYEEFPAAMECPCGVPIAWPVAYPMTARYQTTAYPACGWILWKG